VEYNPYEWLTLEGSLLAIVHDGESVDSAVAGDEVDVIFPRTGFYIESGGQVADTGRITAKDGSWEIQVNQARRPAAGMIVHSGRVTYGAPRVKDDAILQVDAERRKDIMRNHTATHLLHAALQNILAHMPGRLARWWRQTGCALTSPIPKPFHLGFWTRSKLM